MYVVFIAQLDFTVGDLKPISEGHSFHYAGAPYKCLYGSPPYKSPKITENRRKSELQADLRGSLILPPTVKSSCANFRPQPSHSSIIEIQLIHVVTMIVTCIIRMKLEFYRDPSKKT
jgi:hypothetical protein